MLVPLTLAAALYTPTAPPQLQLEHPKLQYREPVADLLLTYREAPALPKPSAGRGAANTTAVGSCGFGSYLALTWVRNRSAAQLRLFVSTKAAAIDLRF